MTHPGSPTTYPPPPRPRAPDAVDPLLIFDLNGGRRQTDTSLAGIEPPPRRVLVGRGNTLPGALGGTGDGTAATCRIDGLSHGRPVRPARRWTVRLTNGDPNKPPRAMHRGETLADAARRGWYPVMRDGRPAPDDWVAK